MEGERLRCEPSSCGSFSVVSWNTAVGLSRFNTSAQWFRAAAQLGMIPVQAKETFSECLSDCESMTRALGTAAGAAGRHYADLMTGAYAGRPVIVAVTDFVERRPPPLIQIGDVPAWSVRVLSTWTFAAAQMTAPLFVGLTIDRSGARSGPDLVVGEPAFDQAFGVWAADPSRAIELLRRRGRPSEIIDVLADFARQGLSVTITDDFVRVGLARVVLDAASIEQWLRALHWSALELEDPRRALGPSEIEARFASTLSEVARELGLTLVEPATLRGAIDGVELWTNTLTLGGRLNTAVIARIPAPSIAGLELERTRPNVARAPFVAPPPDFVLGDPVFDAAFRVVGYPYEGLTMVFHQGLRHKLLSMLAHADVSVRGGYVRLVIPGLVEQPGGLREAARDVVQVARALSLPPR
jgi:hypothetical protein